MLEQRILLATPVVGFSTYFGGSHNDFANGVATDSAGNTYVIGTTKSSDLAGGSGPEIQNNRAFIAKFAADGKLDYMKVLGPTPIYGASGFADSNGLQVVVGPDGLPLVSYETNETSTVPLTDGGFLYLPGGISLHFAKLSETGETQFDTIAPLPDDQPGISPPLFFSSVNVATDDTGAIYAIYDAVRPTAGGGYINDPFLTKVAQDGSVEFATILPALASAIAVDSQHHIYVGVTTSQNDLPVTDGAYQAQRSVLHPGTVDSTTDVWLAEYDPTAFGLLAATYLGGTGNEEVRSIAVDPATPGRVYVVGRTEFGSFPLKNPLQQQPVEENPQTTSGSSINAFLTLIDLNVTQDHPQMTLVASTYYGGNRSDSLDDIVLDRAGNVYVAGSTNSRNLPVVDPLQATYSEGAAVLDMGVAHDFVIAKFDAALSVMLFSTYFGGSGFDGGASLAVDPFGTIHVAGTTSGKIFSFDDQIIATADFPVRNAAQPTFGGGEFGDFLGTPDLETDAVVFTIANDLTVTARPVNAIVGEAYTKPVATFTAPDPTAPASDFTAQINWGDGSPQPDFGTIQKTGNPAAPFQVVGSHVYTRPGAFPVVVTVRDSKDNLVATTAYDVSREKSNQAETTIAVDPNNPQRVFTAANDLLANQPSSLFAGYSTDGGVTWTPATDKTGVLTPAAGTPALPLFGSDPRAAFDQFGNLYLTGLRADLKAIIVLLSVDGGKTFRLIDTFASQSGAANPADDQDPEHAAVDQPSIAVGPGDLPGTGSIWISCFDVNAGTVFAAGARIAGLGQVGDFQLVDLAHGQLGNYGNIAVGPTGQVVATWQNFGSDASQAPFQAILVSSNPDGLKSITNFSPPVVLSAVPAVGFQYVITPQSTRKITPDIRVAWDRSGGPHNGRVYITYTDALSPATAPDDTDIFVRHSDDGGGSWSDPVRVNDDASGHSQFFASLAVDQSTGDVGVAWYDARGSVDNTLTQFFVAVSGDGGQTFSPNVAVSAGQSDATNVDLNAGGALNQYGDYTGLDFARGLLYPAWADNSAELTRNPDRPQFDAAAARVAVAHVIVAPPVVTGLPVNVTEGQTFSDTVATFTDGDSSLSATDFTATIDWGDGSQASPSPGIITPSGTADHTFIVRASHVYATPGAYVIGITVTDNVHNLNASSVSDVSRAAGTQSEGTIAIDPLDPSHLFAVSNSSGRGIFGAYSTDGGVTWNGRRMAGGLDGLPVSGGDPKVVFDQYHNLFLTYLTAESNSAVVVLLSTDFGQSFHVLETFSDPGGTDQPSVAVGPGSGGQDGSVWVTFVLLSDNSIVAAGASVSGPNLVGSFSELQVGPGPEGGPTRNFGDVAVGPLGQVLITYQAPTGGAGPSQVFVNLDTKGLQQPGGFGPPVRVTATNVGGFDPVPPQATRTIDAEANLAWDLTNGPHRGRLYMAYTDAPAVGSPDTNILVRFSDDNGQTWSAPVRVNDDAGAATQFLPSVAVDPTTGDVGVSWYDTRNDPAGVRTQIFAALSNNGGQTFSRNALVSLGTSDATDPGLNTYSQLNQYGDYTGLVFQGGILYPAWADNSSELILNPDLPQFDLAAGRSATAHVTDLPLTATALDISADVNNEGEAFTADLAAFSDADPNAPTTASAAAAQYTVTIDWGDKTDPDKTGTIKIAGGKFIITGTHAYEEEGPHKITITIADKGGASVVVTNDADVADGTLKAQGRDFKPVENQVFRGVVATFTDSDPNGQPNDYTAQIAWGDGSQTPGSVAFSGSAALAWDAAASSFFAIGNSDNLVEISANGVVTNVAALDPSFHRGGLAFDTLNGLLYAISNTDAGVSTLNAFDPVSGKFHAVLSLGTGFTGGLAYDWLNGELYAIADNGSSSTLYQINLSAGTVAAVTNLGPLSTAFFAGLTFDRLDGQLYAAGNDSDGASTLYRITPGGAFSVTPLFSLGTGFTGGLAVVSGGAAGTLHNEIVGINGDGSGSAVLNTISLSGPVAAVFEVGASFNDGFDVVGTHSLGEEALQGVDVSITDAGGSTATAHSSATVVDAAPQAVPAPPTLTILQGIPTGTLSLASFTVPGGLETGPNEYSATINWGDGSPQDTGTLLVVGSVITVTGSHTYATAGTLPGATVTLTDDTGNSASVSPIVIVEPDVTAQVHTSSAGLTFDPITNRFVGDLSITNTSTTDISGPLYVIIHDLPNGVTLDSFTDVDGAGNPLLKIDQSRLSAGASLSPISLVFGNPGHVPIAFTVQVFDGLRIGPVGGADLVFEPNQGQASDAVSFIARGQGYALGLSAGQATLVLKGSANQAGAAALMQIVGASVSSVGEAIDLQPGVSNYFSGGTAITGVSHFGRVRYSDVYSGIDVEYYGKDGLLENDWIVHPGASTDSIDLHFGGVNGISEDAAGNLILSVNGGELVQRAPVAYQIVGGSRHEVTASYQLRADGSVGFVLGAYDHSAALVIDPVLVYSTYLGGSGFDQVNSVAVDAAGNSYVAGTTGSSDFFTVRPFDPQLNQPDTSPLWLSFDAFVSKFDAQGVLVYSSYLGGGASGSGTLADTSGNSIIVDNAGHAWVAGYTQSLLFPTTFAAPLALPGQTDPLLAGGAFLTELADDGSSLVRSTVFGGQYEFVDIAADGAGNIYAAANNGYVLKYDPATNTVPYVTNLGEATAKGITVDSSGQAYLAGFAGNGLVTKNALFPNYLTNNLDPLNNTSDAFVTKLYADGRIAFSTYLGGSHADFASDIAVDRTGVIYVVGTTQSDNLPVPGGVQTTRKGGLDAFLVKLANDGSAVLYGTYLGGSSSDYANAVAVDAAGRAYIGGSTASLDFPQTVKAYQPTDQGGPGSGFIGESSGTEGFAAVLEPDGQSFTYLTYIGGTSIDEVRDVAVDAAGNATYVGVTSSTDFVTSNAAQSQLRFADGLITADGFIVRLNAGDAGTFALHNAPFTAVQGNQFNGLVAFFHSNGTETADQFSAVIDWGDGLTSSGTIKGDFRNGFQVFGSHLYLDVGTHDVFVTLRDSLGRTVTATTTPPAPAGASGRVHYHVAIDTTALAGTQGQLSFQFNPGAIPGSPDVQARITSLDLFGGAGGTITLDGDASQTSSTEFTIKPSTALNRLMENVTLGSRIEFDLELVGPGLSQSTSLKFGDVFAVQLLDANGVTPLLAADSSASLLRVDVSPDGSTQATSSDAKVIVAAGGLATVINAPIDMTLAAFTVPEGTAFNGPVATFTDGDPFETAGQFTARIDWGDGSPVTSGVIAGSHGAFTISGPHVYQQTGSYTLDVTLTDPDGLQVRAHAGRSILAALPFIADWGLNRLSAPSVSGDFNGDGILDVAVGGFSPVPTINDRGVGILLGQGDGSFKLAGFQITGPDVVQLAVADFNHDGKLDVAAAITTFGPSTVELMLGNGDGTLQAPILETALINPGSISAADVNGDGKIDLVYTQSASPTQEGPSNMLEVALGNGDGTFGSPTTTTIPFAFQHVYIADMNNDGVPDVILDSGGAALEYLQGVGDGSFAAPTTFATLQSFQTSLAIQDFNGDGKQDVAIEVGGILDIFTGNGDGTFGSPIQTAASPSNSLVSADFNGDGRPDLATCTERSGTDLGQVQVFINQGAGSFAAGVVYHGVSFPNNLLTGDFDRDGHIDIAASGVSTVISVLPGMGDGTFASAVQYAAGLSDPQNQFIPQAVATADVNGDTHADAVFATTSGSIVTELGKGDGTFQAISSGNEGNVGGTKAPPLLTDVNHDGRLDVVTTLFDSGIRIVLGDGTGAFPTSQVSSPTGRDGATVLADFNHDGRLDVVSDFGSLFSNHGVAVSLAKADGTFQDPVFYPASGGGNGGSMATGDFNGDGNLDIVLAIGSGTVSLLLGNADGTFAAAQDIVVGTYPFNVGNQAEVARVGDFNRDGKLDLVVVDYYGRGLVLPGNGDGTFGAAIPFTTNESSRDLAVGDFNKDGKLDIVTAEEAGQQFSSNTGGVSVLLGNSDGTFQAAVYYAAGLHPREMTLGDFNQDGRLDIAAADSDFQIGNSDSVSILLGNADGTFQTAVNYTVTGTKPQAIVAGDLNGDGKLDLAVVNQSNDAAILLGNGDGTFQPPLNYFLSGGGGGQAVAIGDLNGDGKADLIAGNNLFFGNGDGTFPNHSLFTYLPPVVNADIGHTSIPQDIAAGDLNGDGNMDLAVSMQGTTAILFGNGNGSFQPPIYLNPPAATGLLSTSNRVALVDMDGDGKLDVVTLNQDLVNGGGAIAIWHSNGNGTFSGPVVRHVPVPVYGFFGEGLDMAVGDLNGDGRVDVVVSDGGDNDPNGTSSGGVSVMLGVGDGTLAPAIRYLMPLRQSAYRVTLGDLNRDGRPEIIALTSPFGSFRSAVAVLTNNGDGTFGAAQLYDHGVSTALDLASADFNGDGAADILVPESGAYFAGIFNVIFAGQGPAVVTEAPVAVTGININPSAGVAFTAMVATFTDANPFGKAGDFSATIDWGDGQTSTGSIQVDPLGGFDVTGAHTYASNGVLTTRVTVIETGGGTHAGSATATVSSADQALAASDLVFTAMAGVPFTGAVATFTDADPQGSIGDFNALINWGDGQTTAGTIIALLSGGFSVSGTHVFALPGNLAVRIDITDIGGSSATANSTAQVAPHVNQPPVAINDTYTTAEHTTLVVLAGQGVLVNDTDPEGDPLSAIPVVLPAHGTLTLAADGSLTYVPTANFSGSDSFTYKANDGNADSNVATVNIFVSPVNDPPVAKNDTAVTSEETKVVIDVLANDTGTDGTIIPATIGFTGQPLHGTVSADAVTGAITYTPQANFFGSDSFRYQVRDSNGLLSNAAVVSITVNAVNHLPVAVSDNYVINEDTPLIVAAAQGVLVNDTDVDGNPLTASIVTAAAHGTVTLSPDGSFTYQADANFFGSDSFRYVVTDGTSTSLATTVSLMVLPVNDPPVITPIADQVVGEGNPLSQSGSFTDPDPDDSWTATVDYGDGTGVHPLPLVGTSFALNHSYVDNGNYVATVVVTDQSGLSDSGTFKVTVENLPPVVHTGNNQVVREGALVTVIGNFTDPGVHDTHTATIDWGDGSATVPLALTEANGAGTFLSNHTYADENDYVVTVTVTDNQGDSGVSTLTVNVNNAAPLVVAGIDRTITLGDSLVLPALVTIAGANADLSSRAFQTLAGSFVDPGSLDSHTATIDWGDGTIQAGTVVEKPFGPTGSPSGMSGAVMGTHLYTGVGDFKVLITVTDVDGAAASDSFMVAVKSNNAPPVAANDTAGTNQNAATLINVLANDSDSDGTVDPTTVAIVSAASHGTTSVNPTTGAVTYTPASNYTGPDSFTYTVKDDLGAVSNVATVAITVNAPPVAANDTVTTNKNTATLINVLANDSDPDGTLDPTTVAIVSAASHGTTSVNLATGAVTYTPALNYTGPDSFTYKVKDNLGAASNVATVSITVNAPPVAANDTVTASKNTAVVVNVLSNDSDPDGTINPTTVTIVGATSHGTTSVNPTTGAITYTPAANYTGPDSFTYKVKDNLGADSNVATVSITVRESGLLHGMTASIGFWANSNGQALINSFGKTSTGLTLANWLATTFPNIYGGSSKNPNYLGNKTDVAVACLFIKLFNGASPKLDAQLLATALAVFTTTNSLNTGSSSRALATKYGFTLSNAGAGAALWNVTTCGAAFSLPNNSTASLLDLLKRANAKAVNGRLYGGNKTLINQANVVFSQINVAGEIGA